MHVLERIRVIDWTQWQQGPVSTALLADLGAEVIHVETPQIGDAGRGLWTVVSTDARMPGGRSAYFEINNRHKKSITVSLKHPEGRQVIYDLVKNSDIFVQNFRPGVAERLGVDYETLCKYNPKLIYASATGYGEKGPERERPSYDALAMAKSGIMWNVGEPGMPPLRIEGGFTDQVSAIVTAYGILGAIIARERFGVGQKVVSSQLMSMIAVQGLSVGLMLLKGEPARRQSRKDTINPLWNIYKSKDGKWLALAMLQSDRHWPLFCRALGEAGASLYGDKRFKNEALRGEHRIELIETLDGVFETKPLEEWTRIFNSEPEIFWQSINDLTDLRADLQVRENEYITRFNHPLFGEVNCVGSIVSFSKTTANPCGVAPELGQHTEEVLRDVCGYDLERISELKEKGAI